MGLSSIEIDVARLRGNVRVFRSLLGPGTKLMAVVKGNAYGHGARLTAPVIQELVDWFGVDGLEEAEELAASGIEKPILILGHTEPEDCARVVAGGFRQVLFRRDVAAALAASARRQGRRARVHVKVETGLHRLGVPVSEAAEFASGLEGLDVEGVYTHFADVENPDSALVTTQRERLKSAVSVFAPESKPLLVHSSPTAGALLHREKASMLARVGIGLYGIWPAPETRHAARESAPEAALLPVLSWKSRLVQVKTVPPGATVGYDLTFRASSERRIGVVPVGYYDGYDRKISNRGRVLVRGLRVPVAGRVAMNMFMVDVTEVEAREGDEVVLLGEQGGESVTAEDVASWADTIAYEVLARLNPRLPRRLTGEPEDEGNVGGGPVERS